MGSYARSSSVLEWREHGPKPEGSEPLTTRSPGLWPHTSDTEAASISPARARPSATSVGTCCPVATLDVSGDQALGAAQW